MLNFFVFATDPFEEADNLIDFVPAELLMHVASFCDRWELCQLSSVCMILHIVANDDSLWQRLLQRDFSQLVIEHLELTDGAGLLPSDADRASAKETYALTALATRDRQMAEFLFGFERLVAKEYERAKVVWYHTPLIPLKVIGMIL